MDGKEGAGEEADGLAQAEDIDTGGVKLEDDPEVEAEVGQVEHRGAEADQRHREPEENHLYEQRMAGWISQYNLYTPASKESKFWQIFIILLENYSSVLYTHGPLFSTFAIILIWYFPWKYTSSLYEWNRLKEQKTTLKA